MKKGNVLEIENALKAPKPLRRPSAFAALTCHARQVVVLELPGHRFAKSEGRQKVQPLGVLLMGSDLRSHH